MVDGIPTSRRRRYPDGLIENIERSLAGVDSSYPEQRLWAAPEKARPDPYPHRRTGKRSPPKWCTSLDCTTEVQALFVGPAAAHGYELGQPAESDRSSPLSAYSRSSRERWTPPKLEQTALVAVMLLFTGILASRIETGASGSKGGSLVRRTRWATSPSRQRSSRRSFSCPVCGGWPMVVSVDHAHRDVLRPRGRCRRHCLSWGSRLHRSARAYEVVEKRTEVTPGAFGVHAVRRLRHLVPDRLRKTFWFEPFGSS